MAAQPSPEPKPAPAPVVVPAPRRHRRRWLFVVAIAVIGVVAYRYIKTTAAEQVQKTAFTTAKTATVTMGTIETRLRVTGQTSARSYANIVAPRLRGREGGGGAMMLLSLATSGSFVKKGDVVAEFDPQTFKDRLDDTLATLRDRENDVKKKVVQNELDMENLRQTLRQAQASVDKAKLDFKAAEIRTEIDAELLKLSVEEAEAAYKELSTDMPLEIESQKCDMRITEITKKMDDVRVANQTSDLAKLVIKAPMDGMVVVINMPRPGGDQVTIAVGDQLGPGQPFMKIIDPATMQVEATINQSESSQFRIGQGATVYLDAFPEATYQGKVYAIGALAVSGGRQQYFIRNIPLRVQILNPDKRSIPDLSASADVMLARQEHMLVAPMSAVETEGDKAWVQVKTDKGFERRAVKLGPNNGTHVGLIEGVKEGETVKVN